jgi:uncharacterized membrane protein
MAKLNFSKKEALSYGYKTTWENLKFFIILLVIAGVVYGVSSAIKTSIINSTNSFGPVVAIVTILVWILDLILEMGMIRISLDFVENKKTNYKRLFYTNSLFNYFVVTIIKSVVVLIGFIFLIVPGIILSIKLQYATYFVIDKNLGIGDSLKKSWALTKGIKWNLFLFGLLIGLINIGGAILILIGLLFTIPLTLLANAFVFRKLLSQQETK